MKPSSTKGTEKELWLPPSSYKDRKEATRSGKTKSKVIGNRPGVLTRLRKSLSFKAFFRLILRRKAFWDWIQNFLQLIGIVAISASILMGLSRFGLQQALEQGLLVHQIIQEQDKLAKQQVQEQDKLAKQQVQEQDKLIKQITQVVQQQASLVNQGHQQTLTEYLNSMSALLSSSLSPLKQRGANSPGRLMAQTETIAVLSALKSDAALEGIIIQFLHDSGLISVGTRINSGPIVQLNSVDLSGIKLMQANLTSSNFDGAIMTNANLNSAILTSSSFRGAALTKANLGMANLENVDLSGADLGNADLSGASLKGTNLNGTNVKGIKQKDTT